MATIPLKSIKFPGLPDTYVIPDPDETLSVAGAAADAKVVGGALDTKADKGGTIANAEQLISSVGINDKVPYNFRTTGGSADVGNRKTEKIVGGTIVWNQLINKLRFSGTQYDNSTINAFSVNGTIDQPSPINSPVGHKLLSTFEYYMTSDFSGTVQVRNYKTDGSFSSLTSSTSSKTYANIKSCIAASETFNIRLTNVTAGSINVGHMQVIDITTLFGSTIADYLYALETATPGAGVAKFRQLFPKPYYAYNAGELMSVKTSKAVMTGFNQWDEEWEVGVYDLNTGAKRTATNTIRSKNAIQCVPNAVYYFGTSIASALFYDASGNYLSYAYNNASGNLLTTPNGCYEIRFITKSSYGTTYNHDICINLSWDGERDGEYEEYKTYEYALDSDLELRGIWKLDSNNDIYCDGDEYESDCKVTRKYGIVDLGTLDWLYTSATPNRFRTTLPDGANGTNLICAKYLTTAIKGEDKTLYFFDSYYGTKALVIFDSAYTSAAEFKAAMSGVYLVYELATPTEETADPYTNPMVDDDWGTEELVDAGVEAGSRDVAVPVGHDTFYQANLRAKLEMAPDSPDGTGDYMVRQTDGKNSYVPLSSNTTIAGLVNRVPEAPSEDGTYTLKATVASGVKTYAWVADE